MATAPEPGAARRATEATRIMRLTLQGRTLDLGEVPLSEKMACRSATGMALEQFLPTNDTRTFGEDSFAVLWWLARRANGEPGLSFSELVNTWPRLTADDIGLEVIDDDGEATDDPGKSGDG